MLRCEIPNCSPIKRENYGVNKCGFDKRTDLTMIENLFLPDKTLRIVCKISEDYETFVEMENVTRKRIRVAEEVDETVNIRMKNLLGSNYPSDHKFVTDDGQCIYAHKLILAVKSEVFTGMFGENVKIVDYRQEIRMEHIKYEVLCEILRFVYTTEVKNIDKVGMKLLITIERYYLNDLKIMCEKSLCDTLSKTSAIRSLTLAESYNLSDLKKRAIEFIATNKSDMFCLPDFETLSIFHPSLISEIQRCVVNVNNK